MISKNVKIGTVGVSSNDDYILVQTTGNHKNQCRVGMTIEQAEKFVARLEKEIKMRKAKKATCRQ